MAIPNSGYVFAGAAYLLASPSLWKKIACPFIISMILALALLIVFLATLFPLQTTAFENAGLASGWAGFFAFFLTLAEVAVAVTIVFFILFGEVQQQICTLVSFSFFPLFWSPGSCRVSLTRLAAAGSFGIVYTWWEGAANTYVGRC